MHIYGPGHHEVRCVWCGKMVVSRVLGLFFLLAYMCLLWHPAECALTRTGLLRTIRSYFEAGYPYQLILCFLAAVHGICMSLSTLKRILRRQGLRRRESYSLYYVGQCLIRELQHSGSTLGYRAMHHRMRVRYGVQVPRNTVRMMLAAIDPVGVEERARRRLIRRHYGLKGPNYCWHVDGLDKLKTYGFAIHGCVDGFSRKVLWLEVATTNNDASVVAGYYLQAIAQYGCPRIVRTDRGSENSRIAFLQPFLRRNGQDSFSGTGSFQYGRSASNQRIGAWWSQLRRWFTTWWMDFFKMLKETGEFDETNHIHIDCIRFCFMEILQKELDETREMWNSHLIRRARTSGQIHGIPEALYSIPELRGFRNYRNEVDFTDLQLCCQYCEGKPNHVPDEFTELANIVMTENDWRLPQTSHEGLVLYLNLKNCIESESVQYL